ncbi:FAD-dependent monooxygenase [Cystobacter fuscus]|uniref:FAD-dependent monooxygenase n=1 Tax=Cystobacter fuscus TaxID=43 RepID=UPI002B2FE5D9|nr:NAD(P)-binding protein [Cystobacter fuscus]
MVSRPRILIAGGGIGGLAAALALQRAGFEPRVFEQAPRLQPVGAGIQLSPNATRTLVQLGCGEALRDVAVAPGSLHVKSWRTGRNIFSTPLGTRCLQDYGAPYYHVHRADLHAVLLKELGPEPLHLGARCTGFVEEEGGVRVELEDGSHAWGDMLIGADGIHSSIRTAAFGPEQPRFSGYMAFRAVLPAERIQGLRLQRDLTSWWGPGRHFVHYFISGGRQLNYVAVVPTRTWHLESWSVEGSREELLSEFQGWHPVLQELIRATDRVFKWALYDRDPLPRWSRGRVTLLGDAAHPMLPFQAQGGAQAIEDAVVLTSCLTRHAGRPQEALEEYERLRKPRTHQVQMTSRGSAQLFHLDRPLQVLKRNTRLRLTQRFRPDVLAHRMDWLYEHDALAEAERFRGL